MGTELTTILPRATGRGDRSYRFAVMPGDGVGPELVEQALRVLERVATADGFEAALVQHPHSLARRETERLNITPATMDEIGTCDSLLFGAAGSSETADAYGPVPLMAISAHLDLSLGVRPVRMYADRLSPLKDADAPVDIVIVRDTSEDALASPGGVLHEGLADEVSVGTLVYTSTAVDRALRYGFRLAEQRNRRLHMVAQTAGLRAHGIWHRRLMAIAPEFPHVDIEEMLPDTAASQLVENPGAFDVIVTTFWLGGILSNLMATVAGGVGLLPSARLNVDAGFGLFEPAHGTAPRHVGRGTVSPVATIRAVAMMLTFVGEQQSAARIERAIATALTSGRLPDVTTRSGVSTAAATDLVLGELG